MGLFRPKSPKQKNFLWVQGCFMQNFSQIGPKVSDWLLTEVNNFWVNKSIKRAAPSSENWKSVIKQNVLVRPGLRKKMLRKSQFFTNWEKSQKIRILNLFFKILFSKKYIDTYFWNHQQIAEVMRFPKLGDIFQKSWLCPHKSSKNWKTHFWKP